MCSRVSESFETDSAPLSISYESMSMTFNVTGIRSVLLCRFGVESLGLRGVEICSHPTSETLQNRWLSIPITKTLNPKL